MSSAEVLKQTTTVRQGHELDAPSLERYLADACRAFAARSRSVNSRAANRIPLISSSTPGGDYVFAKNRPVSCCRRRTRSIVNTA